MDSTEPAQEAGAQDPAEAEAQGKDCLLCDRVLAAGGAVFALVLLYMCADLLSGGSITAALFGRRDRSVWDVAEAEAPAAAAEGEAPSA